MQRHYFLILLVLQLILLLINGHTNIGFDTTTPFLGQDFFDCVARRLNWDQKGFAIIPYDPSGDFADQVTKAKKAGFREVHLLLDPENFPFVSINYLPSHILEALRTKGTFVAGFWVKVNSNSRFWTRKRMNIKKLQDLLNGFEDAFSEYGGTSVGVYTTGSGWMDVIGTEFANTQFNSSIKFKYWSAIDDDELVCFSNGLNNSICSIKQIQYKNLACGAPFNVNVKIIPSTAQVST